VWLPAVQLNFFKALIDAFPSGSQLPTSRKIRRSDFL
jgi:hypothetical protein